MTQPILRYWPLLAVAAFFLADSFCVFDIDPKAGPDKSAVVVELWGKSIDSPLNFLALFVRNILLLGVFATALFKVSQWKVGAISEPIHRYFERPLPSFLQWGLRDGRMSEYIASFLILSSVAYLAVSLRYLFI